MGEQATVTPVDSGDGVKSRALPAPITIDLSAPPERKPDELESEFLHRLLVYEAVTMDIFVKKTKAEIIRRAERIRIIEVQYYEAADRDKNAQSIA